jgi:hypothetical protein
MKVVGCEEWWGDALRSGEELRLKGRWHVGHSGNEGEGVAARRISS